MRQYRSIKTKHPDAILLFRVGDFYETFSEDAIKASEILGITLTRRANGAASFIELAGFPYHALDTYLPKLVRAGQRVAICEQLEDPKLTKNIVKRGVIELVTPGVSIGDNILNHKENNYLACIHFDKKSTGAAFLDLSTGEFYVAEGKTDYIDKLISSLKPKEILFERGRKEELLESLGTGFYTYPLDDWLFSYESCLERLQKQFDTVTLKGFGIQHLTSGITAAGAILFYLDLTHHEHTHHISRIARIDEELYVWMDKFTIRNLELFLPNHEGGTSLVDVIDRTTTPMGGRLLKRWTALPLKDPRAINNRLDAVEFFVQHAEIVEAIGKSLKMIGDLERLISKVALNRVTPREMQQLRVALDAIAPLREICLSSGQEQLRGFADQLNPCTALRERIVHELHDDPPAQVNKGQVIAAGVNAELDELRTIAYSGKDYLANLQDLEARKTGIASLKIGFNNVFGYYFEVRNTYKNRVPKEWIRKQTLVSAERYINEELKNYETKILGAEEKILEIETRLFNELVAAVGEYIVPVQHNAFVVAQIDCLVSFARLTTDCRYTKPLVDESDRILIKGGRHPVIERLMPVGEEYIPNDTLLDSEQQIIIITGPNMAGKSALLRQTALIVLLAQMGCFVPAEQAQIGAVDKIFTRVGASDNISSGESTFMVEMLEASSILNNITPRSLVLFDELGRGTSTYDGISIAWAIVEYLHEQPHARAKTLFATHYHELNEMESGFPRIKNYNVTVKEVEDKDGHGRIIFLRKLVRGGSAHSFGIHVARMAGMPKSIVSRAGDILVQLESNNGNRAVAKPVKDISQKREGYQLSFFQLDDPVLSQVRDQIRNLDINNLTPIEALNRLSAIQHIILGKH